MARRGWPATAARLRIAGRASSTATICNFGRSLRSLSLTSPRSGKGSVGPVRSRSIARHRARERAHHSAEAHVGSREMEAFDGRVGPQRAKPEARGCVAQTSTPPTAATTGSSVRRHRYRAPPGITASSTSSVTRPTNSAIDVVDEEPQGVREAKGTLARAIGPRQRDQHTDRQQREVVDGEGQRHVGPPLDRSEVDVLVKHDARVRSVLPRRILSAAE